MRGVVGGSFLLLPFLLLPRFLLLPFRRWLPFRLLPRFSVVVLSAPFFFFLASLPARTAIRTAPNAERSRFAARAFRFARSASTACWRVAALRARARRRAGRAHPQYHAPAHAALSAITATTPSGPFFARPSSNSPSETAGAAEAAVGEPLGDADGAREGSCVGAAAVEVGGAGVAAAAGGLDGAADGRKCVVGDALGDALGPGVGLPLGPRVLGLADGPREGLALGPSVGEALGNCDGAALGRSVGPALGSLVDGLRLGALVGAALGTGDGDAVGAGVLHTKPRSTSQRRLAQSPSRAHRRPDAHGGHSPPPQSTSDSLPFW